MQKKITNPRDLEKYSSAFTLSDMEIFIFPELFYPLVLANIMSPVIWKWRDHSWFANIHKKSFTYKVNRIKQFIMDNYVFNLDLETWGLTQKQTELNRFKEFIDFETLRSSNALFGYEGDKYYFSIDIRKHFGLDKYTDDAIPYWKTETVEAMTAFKLKEGYTTGAGECVSLAALYAAAMYVVGEIPLEKIYLMATPLHSQNFIAEKDGLITNNRRIVTKNMWYNGTMLTEKARRAMENEKVTLVSHITGHIHTSFKDATIHPDAYQEFSCKLRKYLDAELTFETFINYLRSEGSFWNCFQYRHIRNGKPCYIEIRSIFEYEHGSKNSLSGNSRDALLAEIDAGEFHLVPRTDKVVVNLFEEYLDENPDAAFEQKRDYFLENILVRNCPKMREFFDGLQKYLHIEPRLPETSGKTFRKAPVLNIVPGMSREEVIHEVFSRVEESETAELALYAYRQMDRIDWTPFIKAALERNPVSNLMFEGKTPDQVYEQLIDMPNDSVYEGCRLAQPDEVANFLTGDGIEKAFVLANFIRDVYPEKSIMLKINHEKVSLSLDSQSWNFISGKEISKEICL
jgi:hypothetical protein